MPTPGDAAATFCATIVDEWHRCGVRTAVVAPGSRSTPLAVAIAEHQGIDLHLFHDERSASFAALGVGLALGRPALLVCTSGTAAAQFHAAVVEAHQSAVPMIVCTADRPPELHGIGAPQTIDQQRLYGEAVREFIDAGVPEFATSSTWRTLAQRAWQMSLGRTPGPVHVNFPFREPLLGVVGELPARSPSETDRSIGQTVEAQSSHAGIDDVVSTVSGKRGVLISGAGSSSAVISLASALGWPVFADARSEARIAHSHSVHRFDAILRVSEFVADNRPDVIVRIGEPPASKVLSQWISTSSATVVQVTGDDRRIDPELRVSLNVGADIDELLLSVASQVGPCDSSWIESWSAAENAAQVALGTAADDSWCEPAIARVVTSMRSGPLVVSSSMPIRDVEWYGTAGNGQPVFSNRGANGIDGVVSTAVGVATVTFDPTYLLIGDVAFVHDSNGLWNLAERGVDIRIIVVNNNGGSIFSFLPQRQQLSSDRFEQLFGTPHKVDLCSLAAAHGIVSLRVQSLGELRDALRRSGPIVIEAVTDRAMNVAEHDRINSAMADAIRGVTGG